MFFYIPEKNVLYLLEETRLLEYKLVDSSIVGITNEEGCVEMVNTC